MRGISAVAVVGPSESLNRRSFAKLFNLRGWAFGGSGAKSSSFEAERSSGPVVTQHSGKGGSLCGGGVPGLLSVFVRWLGLFDEFNKVVAA